MYCQSMRYGELAGQNFMVVTLGLILPSGALTRKKRKAEEWLEANDAREIRRGMLALAWVLSADCAAFRSAARRHGDFDVDQFLWKLDIRRVDEDDPFFWYCGSPNPDRRKIRERSKALRRLGHDGDEGALRPYYLD